jgi:hypothetical protein
MIPLIVFTIHVIALAAAFTRRWQEEGVSGGLLAVFFMALIFFVGWSMTSFIVKLVMPSEGLGPLLDRDACSLLLLTIAESVFYYFYLKGEEIEGERADEEPG